MTSHVLLHAQSFPIERSHRLTVDERIAVHRAELRLAERRMSESRAARRRARVIGTIRALARVTVPFGHRPAPSGR